MTNRAWTAGDRDLGPEVVQTGREWDHAAKLLESAEERERKAAEAYIEAKRLARGER